MKPYVVAFIFARGGSKGVPRKNVRNLAGKPLIAHSIEVAQRSAMIDSVNVSTEDRKIADVARQYGAATPFIRPRELALDDSPEWMAWQHAIRTWQASHDQKMDVFVSVPPTSPLRSVDDIDRCIQTLLDTDADIVITVREAERSPYYNMVCIDPAGRAQLVIQPEAQIHQRQAAPIVYDMTTVAYVARPAFILNAHSIFAGTVQAVLIPKERAIDIDTELDFRFAEFLISESV